MATFVLRTHAHTQFNLNINLRSNAPTLNGRATVRMYFNLLEVAGRGDLKWAAYGHVPLSLSQAYLK